MPRILVVGRSGQLAQELTRASTPDGWIVTSMGSDLLDLANANETPRAIAAFRPDAVINAAAYTAVDKAESEPERAFALNRDGPAALAKVAADLGAPLIHVSTDYVFAGDKPKPYVETDPKAPLGIYGRSKSEGEDAVLAAHDAAAILRTSWVYSAHGVNFVKTMLRLSETRDEISVVADQIGRPTAAADLAAACIAVCDKLLVGASQAVGIFHFTNAGDATWADFAEEIFAGAAARGRNPVRVRRITTADYPTPAKRPANSRLDTTKIETVLAIRPRSWRAALSNCLDELLPT